MNNRQQCQASRIVWSLLRSLTNWRASRECYSWRMFVPLTPTQPFTVGQFWCLLGWILIATDVSPVFQVRRPACVGEGFEGEGFYFANNLIWYDLQTSPSLCNIFIQKLNNKNWKLSQFYFNIICQLITDWSKCRIRGIKICWLRTEKHCTLVIKVF